MNFIGALGCFVTALDALGWFYKPDGHLFTPDASWVWLLIAIWWAAYSIAFIVRGVRQ